jgi:hypothetical protein
LARTLATPLPWSRAKARVATIDPKMANDLSFKLNIVAIQLTNFFNTFDMQTYNHLHQFLTYKSIILHYHYQNTRTKSRGTKTT